MRVGERGAVLGLGLGERGILLGILDGPVFVYVCVWVWD